MGRTQPSLTRAVDYEFQKLVKVAEKLRDKELKDALENAIRISRSVEEAFEDELTDPIEVVLIAVLLSCRRLSH